MINVLFVCHGNICRSPMAEFLFKKMVKDNHLEEEFYIESCATSNEEIGNRVHYGTREILDRFNIDYSMKRARRITSLDYEKFDYILCMDRNNIYNLKYVIGNDTKHKVHLLLEYANLNRDIRDPWYTDNFEETYEDIMLGLNSFLTYVKKSLNR